MKQKFYSPFFLLVATILLISCSENANKPALRNASSYYNDIKRAHSIIVKADSFYKRVVYDSAYFYYNNSKQLLIKHNDSLRIVYVLTQMADMQINAGDYSGCEATATDAVPYLSKDIIVADTLKYHEKTFNLLGRCYRKRTDYELAIKYFSKAIDMSNDSLSKSVIYNNMASVYSDSKDYFKALSILERLNMSDVVAKDKMTKGRVLNNLGQVYYILKRPEAAKFIEEGYAMRRGINDWRGVLSSYLQLSELYSQTNKILSEDYAIKAYELATKLKISDSRKNALWLLVTKSSGAEQSKRIEQYHTLSESLESVQLKAKYEFAKIKYDSKEAQDNLKKQETKNIRDEEEHRFKVRLIIFGSVILFIIGALLFYIKRLEYKKEKVLEAYVTETRISKKIHDELANDMFEVMVYAETQDFLQAGQRQKLVRNLDSIYTKTRDISRESNTIDTGENFPAVLKDMLADYKTDDTSVMFIKYDSIDWKSISEPKKIAVYRVLQELMVNMKKHSGANVTVLRFGCEGKKVTIQYNDNGKGLDPDKIFYKNGLLNADTRMKSVNGSITFENGPEKGLKALIEFTL